MPDDQLDQSYQSALAAHRRGRLADAERDYRRLLAAWPEHVDALHGLATLLEQTDQAIQARALIERALRIEERAELLLCHGGVLSRLGRHEAALASLERALARKPDFVEALFQHGNVLAKLGRYAEALGSYSRALSLRPDYVEAHCNRGAALQALGRHGEALDSYAAALALSPEHVAAHFNSGNALSALGRLDEALIRLERALAIAPDYVQAHNNMGLILHALGRYEEALACYGRALAIAPDFAPAHNNKGNTLKQLKRFDAALAAYAAALALNDHFADASNNLGNTLRELGRYEDALARYRQILAFDPGHADANWNEGLLQLALGNFRVGWEKYEWRWRIEHFSSIRQHFTQPLWLGEPPLAGKTILLHAEQGFGDTLQFCRYASLVKALGARVVLQVQPELKALMMGLAGVDALLAVGEPLPAFDYQCPLMSLPLALGTELETIPAGDAYLTARPERVAHWRARLATVSGPRIGLVWSGNSTHANDYNRSIPLEMFVHGLGRRWQFIALQKEVRPGDQPTLEREPNIHPWGLELTDFSDTAALVENLDLVITVDTSVAHLAGALGKPVWIMLSFVQDWRWLRARDDCPWYPSARLFRQPAMDDWRSVFQRLGQALEAFAPPPGG